MNQATRKIRPCGLPQLRWLPAHKPVGCLPRLRLHILGHAGVAQHLRKYGSKDRRIRHRSEGPPLQLDEAEPGAGSEAVALKIFVGDAPDGATCRRKHKLFDGNTAKADARDVQKIVVALDEVGIQDQEVHEEQKIQNCENDNAYEHGRNQIAAKKSDNDRADPKRDRRAVNVFVGVHEMQYEKDYENHDERCVVFLATFLSAGRKRFFEEDLADDRRNAADGSGPEKVLNSHADVSVEVKQRGRRPILWNEQEAGERQRSGDYRAPDYLGAIAFSDEVAGQPGSVEKKRSDQVREVIVHRDSPYISGDFSRSFVAGFFVKGRYILATSPGLQQFIQNRSEIRRLTRNI